MKLLLFVEETGVMVIFHPVRSWQTNPQLSQNVLLLSFGVVHCVIFLNQITDNACDSENSVLHSD